MSSAFPGVQDHRTRSSTVNKSPSESMSFITEVICKFIFTDVHMRKITFRIGLKAYISAIKSSDDQVTTNPVAIN